MSHTPHIEQDPLVAKSNPDRLKAGTLSYTKASLCMLFLWMLWGDFCFSLMETVVPQVLPLKLHDLGASNIMVGILVTTIPNLMNAVINPVVSFRSDRFRSRWGRRTPFLAVATPFLVIFLILLGFSEQIGLWVHRAALGGQLSQISVILLTMGVLMVGFQFFNDIVNSVYWYMFNDVVPNAFLARFMALFRIVGGAASSAFSFFLLPHANTHMPQIFTGAALAFFFAFGLMFWRVKEGEYPPPPPNVDGRRGLRAAIKTYAVECFSHRFYWFFFIANACFAMTWTAQSFRILQLQSVGIGIETIAKVGGVAALVSMALLYPASIVADRLHPLRVLIAAACVGLLVQALWLVFLFRDFSHATTVAIYIGGAIVGLPAGALYTASEFPMYMKLLPRERYGQFCSANAMVRSVIIISSGILCGGFLDAMARLYPVKDYCYRFLPCWNILFNGMSIVFLLLLYRAWKRLGGLHGYKPPSVASDLGETAPAPVGIGA